LAPPGVAAIAGALRDAGVLRDAGCDSAGRVALLCGNSPAFGIVRDAVTALGATLVPLNPRLAAPELAYALELSRAGHLVVEPGLIDDARSALGQCSSPPRCWLLADEHAPGFAALYAAARAASPGRAPGPTEIGATLLFTSGTTGRPKGCLRGDGPESARAAELVSTYGMTASDVHLIACPLAHSAPGIFLRAARSVGARNVILPRFDAEGFVAAVERERATLFFLVPTQYERLVHLPAAVRQRCDMSSVRVAIVAGAPMAPATKRAVVDWLGPGVLWEFYGSTETGTVAVLDPDHQLSHPGAVGRPPPGVDVELRDDRGARVDAGDIGEVFVRSPALMTGYLDPETGAAVARPPWVSVGDLGRFDDDGFLYLVDRKHDTIISGGVNVYPAEVERALKEHPDVVGAVVFAVADDDWGQLVAAAVARRPGAQAPDGGALREFLRDRIAAYKIPKAIAFLAPDELPIGASGKPLRRRAAEVLIGSRRLERVDHK